ncbi:Hypothetical protein PHPALM_1919, partial [Phytophthora palmivora]
MQLLVDSKSRPLEFLLFRSMKTTGFFQRSFSSPRIATLIIGIAQHCVKHL